MATVNRELITEALRESNAIEGVRDKKSLADALAAWDFVIAQKTLTPDILCATHRVLMRNQPLEPKWQGVFRRHGMTIGGQPHALVWQDVPVAMSLWCDMTMAPKPDWEKLHILYQLFHPFADGNGRTGRIFMNWTRVKRCKLPPLVVYERKKWDYYELFS